MDELVEILYRIMRSLEEELKKLQKEKHNPNLTMKNLFDTPTFRPLRPKFQRFARVIDKALKAHNDLQKTRSAGYP